jgi:hypothetical protein
MGPAPVGRASRRRRVRARRSYGRGEGGILEPDRRTTARPAVREMPRAPGAKIRGRAETRVRPGRRPRSAQGRDVETPQRCQRRPRIRYTGTGRLLRELRPHESDCGVPVTRGPRLSRRAFARGRFKRTLLRILHLSDLLADLSNLTEVPSMFYEMTFEFRYTINVHLGGKNMLYVTNY